MFGFQHLIVALHACLPTFVKICMSMCCGSICIYVCTFEYAGACVVKVCGCVHGGASDTWDWLLFTTVSPMPSTESMVMNVQTYLLNK